MQVSKIDELSRALGNIEGTLQGIFEQLDALQNAHKELAAAQERHHSDNLGRLNHLDDCTDELKRCTDALEKNIADLNSGLTETRRTLTMMEPLMASQTLTAGRRGALIGIAVTLLSAMGWLVEHFVVGLVQWVWTHIHWT